MTFADQLLAHLNFLHGHGLDVQELKIGGIVRCHAIGSIQPRGDFTYKTFLNPMTTDGWAGLVTWCRSPSGEHTFNTYGLGQDAGEALIPAIFSVADDGEELKRHEVAARRAYGFWGHSSISGTSCYLTGKGVGSYGIRFRSSEKYGNVAVVPMRDEAGHLWNYQLLNPDGSKLMSKESRTNGLFHKLRDPVNGQPVGIAESYVTSATCYELSGMPLVCAFSANNLKATAQSIRNLYPNSPIIFFADNDQHLAHRGIKNLGIFLAQDALIAVDGYGGIAHVEFVDSQPSKACSDWNDFVRLNGFEFARSMLLEKVSRVMHAIPGGLF